MADSALAPTPGEGRPPDVQRWDWRPAILLMLVLVVGGLIALRLRTVLSLPRIPVAVVADRSHLRITGTGTAVLPPLTLNVNRLDGHRFTLPGLKPGETVTLGWERFMDGDRPLDPQATPPELILLRARGYEVTLVNVSRLTP